MAIHNAVLVFKYYLYNRKFVILSNVSFQNNNNNKKKTDLPVVITIQWLMELSEYSYAFKYIPGTINVLTDYLFHFNFENRKFSHLTPN